MNQVLVICGPSLHILEMVPFLITLISKYEAKATAILSTEASQAPSPKGTGPEDQQLS
jgi:hypothetical protein